MKKFTLKLLAAAVALAAATGAQAAVEVTNGNGDLFVSLVTATGASSGHGTAAFDLGFTMSQAQTWNGVSNLQLQWNLRTGAFLSNNSAIAASNPTLGSYGTALQTFQNTVSYKATGGAAAAQFSVLAFDATGSGSFGTAGQSFMSTANGFISGSGIPTQPSASFGPTNDAIFSASGNTTVANYNATMNADAGMAVASGVGANTAVFGENDHYNANSGMQSLGGLSGFDNNGQYNGNYTGTTNIFSGQARAMPFFQFYASSLDGGASADRVAFGVDLDGDGAIEFDNNGATAGGSNEFGLWRLQGDFLSYTQPELISAPIPEPSTYAMMLAGLALLGGMARRRLK